MTISDEMVETVARAMDDFEMPDGDPFGVLIFNSEYVLPSNRMDMIEQKAEIIRSIARAALTAALHGSVVVPEWQDISTAPKDGRKILVWPYWSDDLPCEVYWRDMKRIVGRWEITPSFFCHSATPTHWRPVPAPPVPRHERGDTK